MTSEAREFERVARWLRENRKKVQTNGVVSWIAIDSFESAVRLLEHHARQLRARPVEDDFGDASIQRAMIAARERGEDIYNMPNPSRLRGSDQ